MLYNSKNVFFGGQIRSRFPGTTNRMVKKVKDMDGVRTVLSSMVHATSGYHFGQGRDRTFPSSQKALWNNTGSDGQKSRTTFFWPGGLYQ